MNFDVDKQTMNDLEIFSATKNQPSLFSVLNNETHTLGGKNRIEEILRNPLSDIQSIKKRSEAIAFFQEQNLDIEINKNELGFIEYYLEQGDRPTQVSRFRAIEKAFFNRIRPNNDYYIIERGIDYTIELLNTIHTFSLQLMNLKCPPLLHKFSEEIVSYFTQKEYEDIPKIKNFAKLTAIQIAKFDCMFRHSHNEQIRFCVNLAYEYDAFQSIARTTKKRNFTFPDILPANDGKILIEGLFHPLLENAVKNDISFTKTSNLCFISGPNMAGKSTFLRSLGIAAYLAHAGLPVPAEKMCISILSGLNTTINLPDSLHLGYSHFYGEVMRIKEVAKKIKIHKNMLIIFDEMFRGTNVKDAYDGSLAVIKAFSKIPSCFYVISSHIVELAEELKSESNIQYGFLDIENQNGTPVYTYKFKTGISDCRLGMYIIQKENVIETINDIYLPIES